MFNIILIIGFNLFIAYIISFWSLIGAVGWFCLAIGFQYGKWYGKDKKEEEFIAREEIIRDEYKNTDIDSRS